MASYSGVDSAKADQLSLNLSKDLRVQLQMRFMAKASLSIKFPTFTSPQLLISFINNTGREESAYQNTVFRMFCLRYESHKGGVTARGSVVH